jgi:hypothetical protein
MTPQDPGNGQFDKGGSERDLPDGEKGKQGIRCSQHPGFLQYPDEFQGRRDQEPVHHHPMKSPN